MINKIIDIAKGLVGVKEDKGSNRGNVIDAIQKEFGMKGQQYCSMFAVYCILKAFPSVKIGYEKRRSELASSQNLFEWAKANNLIYTDPKLIKPGDLVIWRKLKLWQGHVGVCITNFDETTKSFRTVEGNAQPLTSNILTTTGWKKMGEVAIGDCVIDPAGEESHITGVFPKGNRSVYRVSFGDGSSVECCDEHLWELTNISYKYNDKYQKVIVNTLKLSDMLSKNKKLRIPYLVPPNFQSETLPLDPYLLGVLLGDGSLKSKYLKLTNNDLELIENVSNIANSMGDRITQIKTTPDKAREYYLNGPAIRKAIQELGLSGHGSATKFIPEIYKWGSATDRLALLQGLMDTDGTIDHDGRMGFCTTSLQLALDVQHLICSLGGKVKIRKKTNIFYTSPTQKTKKQASDAYVLGNIRFANDVIPFKLSRKIERYKKRDWARGYNVTKVEYLREDEVQCISVSCASKLYITDNWIPTHNTSNSDLGGPNAQRDGDGIYERIRYAKKTDFDVDAFYIRGFVDTTKMLKEQNIL